MWVNPEKNRSIALSVRYYSSENYCGKPDTDEQHVTVVEYVGESVDEQIKRLKLKCEGEGNAL